MKPKQLIDDQKSARKLAATHFEKMQQIERNRKIFNRTILASIIITVLTVSTTCYFDKDFCSIRFSVKIENPTGK